jgi:ribosomal protein L27
MQSYQQTDTSNETTTHAHICVKCGRLYVHAHKGRHAEHLQWAYQCPYETCTWYSGDKPEGMTPGEQRRDALKGWTVLDLDNLLESVQKLGKERPYTRKDAKATLAGMVPFSVAKDWREKKACEFMWDVDQSGLHASCVVEPGSYTVGIKAAGTRKVWQTPFSLAPAQLEYLQKAYPAYWFITGTRVHDHPVAHITTQIATRALSDRLRKDKSVKKVLDLHGNPSANRMNTRATGVVYDTVVEKVLPADYIRAAGKWEAVAAREDDACSVFESAMRDITTHPTQEWVERLDSYTDFMSVHTLYYYQKDEIAALLKARPGSRLHAIVHKHAGLEGSLNNGEQTWYREECMGVDHIYQDNVLTGRQYNHPNIDWVFSGAQSHCDENVGFGWDITLIADNTYHVLFTNVPVKQCRMDVNMVKGEVRALDKPVFEVLVNGNRTSFSKVNAKVGQEMCTLVASKARTAQQFKDHMATTKRRVNKAGITDPSVVFETGVWSFFVNLEAERSTVTDLFDMTANGRRAFKKSLDGVSHMDALSWVGKVLLVGELVVDNHTSWKKLTSGALRTVRENL